MATELKARRREVAPISSGFKTAFSLGDTKLPFDDSVREEVENLADLSKFVSNKFTHLRRSPPTKFEKTNGLCLFQRSGKCSKYFSVNGFCATHLGLINLTVLNEKSLIHSDEGPKIVEYKNPRVLRPMPPYQTKILFPFIDSPDFTEDKISFMRGGELSEDDVVQCILLFKEFIYQTVDETTEVAVHRQLWLSHVNNLNFHAPHAFVIVDNSIAHFSELTLVSQAILSLMHPSLCGAVSSPCTAFIKGPHIYCNTNFMGMGTSSETVGNLFVGPITQRIQPLFAPLTQEVCLTMSYESKEQKDKKIPSVNLSRKINY